MHRLDRKESALKWAGFYLLILSFVASVSGILFYIFVDDSEPLTIIIALSLLAICVWLGKTKKTFLHEFVWDDD